MCQSYLFSINFIPLPTFFSFVQNMDPEKQKPLELNQETNQIVQELLQIFQRTEKNLDLLQQTNQIVQKLLEIFQKKNINLQHTKYHWKHLQMVGKHQTKQQGIT